MKYNIKIELVIEQADKNRKLPEPDSVRMAFHHLIESGSLRSYINDCAWNNLHDNDTFESIVVNCSLSEK